MRERERERERGGGRGGGGREREGEGEGERGGREIERERESVKLPSPTKWWRWGKTKEISSKTFFAVGGKVQTSEMNADIIYDRFFFLPRHHVRGELGALERVFNTYLFSAVRLIFFV